jgi:hypothetical protein
MSNGRNPDRARFAKSTSILTKNAARAKTLSGIGSPRLQRVRAGRRARYRDRRLGIIAHVDGRSDGSEGSARMSDPDDDEDLDADFDLECDRQWRLLHRPRKWASLAHRIGDVNVIDPTKVHLPGLPGHRILVLLVLLLAMKDFATELRLEPWYYEGEEGNEGRAPELRMFYEVDGQFYELVPAPGLLAPLVARDLAIMAGFERPDDRVPGLLRRLADWIHRPDPPLIPGRIRWRHGDFEGDIEVVIYPSEWGDRLFLRLPEIPVVASDRAQARLIQIMEAMRKPKGKP